MNSEAATRDPFVPGGGRRPVLIVFAPGLGSVARAPAPRAPALERLLARRRRAASPGGPWEVLARLLGGTTGSWPVAPVSFAGEGGEPRGGCLRVAPVGADPEGRGDVGIPAAELALTSAEAGALAERFDRVLGEDRLTLHAPHPRRWYLAGTPGWRGGDDWRPRGPLAGEPGLLRLVSEAEMLFHDHPVNRDRVAAGRPVVATLHPWGGGGPPGAGPARVPGGWGAEPYLRGLWRAAGALPEPRPGALFAARGLAWPGPGEEVDGDLPARLERDLAEPGLGALVRGRLGEVRIVTEDASFAVTAWRARRAWRRPRPLGELLC